MTALASISDTIQQYTDLSGGNPEHIFWWKDDRVASAVSATPVAGQWSSLRLYNGHPCRDSVSSTGLVNYTNTSIGGMRQSDPAGGKQRWLTFANAWASQPGILRLVDLIASYNGLAGNTNAVQSTTGLADTRYTATNSVGVVIGIEITLQVGVTATLVSATYVNNSGVSNTAIFGFGNTGNREAQRIIWVPLANGEQGVKSVSQVQLAASTGTQGAFNVFLAKPIHTFPLPDPEGACPIDLLSAPDGPTEIITDMCIVPMWLAQTAVVVRTWGELHMVDK